MTLASRFTALAILALAAFFTAVPRANAAEMILGGDYSTRSNVAQMVVHAKPFFEVHSELDFTVAFSDPAQPVCEDLPWFYARYALHWVGGHVGKVCHTDRITVTPNSERGICNIAATTFNQVSRTPYPAPLVSGVGCRFIINDNDYTAKITAMDWWESKEKDQPHPIPTLQIDLAPGTRCYLNSIVNPPTGADRKIKVHIGGEKYEVNTWLDLTRPSGIALDVSYVSVLGNVTCN